MIEAIDREMEMRYLDMMDRYYVTPGLWICGGTLVALAVAGTAWGLWALVTWVWP